MQPFRKQKSHPKFSRNGRPFEKLHQQLCGHGSTSLSANPERHKIQVGKTRRGKRIQKDTRQHLKRQDNGIL